MHITIINDDPIQFESIALALASSGAVITSTHLNRIVVNPECLAGTDVIIIDLNAANLPQKCAFIRQMTAKPLIVLSVNADYQSIADALNSGIDDYVVKPVHGDELIVHINSLFKRIHPNLLPVSI